MTFVKQEGFRRKFLTKPFLFDLFIKKMRWANKPGYLRHHSIY